MLPLCLFSRRVSRPSTQSGQETSPSGGRPKTVTSYPSLASSLANEDGGPFSTSRKTWRRARVTAT